VAIGVISGGAAKGAAISAVVSELAKRIEHAQAQQAAITESFKKVLTVWLGATGCTVKWAPFQFWDSVKYECVDVARTP